MEDSGWASSAAGSVRAVLEGGPASFPEAWRVQAVGPQEEKIKIPHYGGYEHFERVGGFDGNGFDGNGFDGNGFDGNGFDGNGACREVVFVWTMRTEMAE
jgi:hypothetical protein